MHRRDARIKLISVLSVCVTVMTVRFASLAVLAPFLVAAAASSGIKANRIITELQYFFVFMAVIFLVRAWSEEAEPICRWGWLSLPPLSGLTEALLLTARLTMIILVSLVLTSTTRTSDLREAVYRLLYRIPFIPASRIAVMMGLAIGFIPVLMRQYEEITEASHSRCIGTRKNPAARLVTLARPLLTGIFRRADEIAEAMASRCYTEEHAKTATRAKKGDWIFLICSLSLSACSIGVNVILM